MENVLFIHGFASSGQSAKSADLSHILDAQIIAPDLSHQPFKDMAYLEQIIQQSSIEMIVGSSLGGFYALLLAVLHPKKLVLINPSLSPELTLHDQLGYVESFKGGGFEWTAQHMSEMGVLKQRLQDAWCENQQQLLQACLVLLAEHDERLNYQDAVTLLTGATIVIDHEQDHRFSDLQRYAQHIQQLFLA